MYKDFVRFVRALYKTDGFIPLHEPIFPGNEKKYVLDAIDSTFVSSVGKYVDQFEMAFAKFVGAKYAIATVNGTAALHAALELALVSKDDEVITQPLVFVATCNAIRYCGAEPIFVDIDKNTLGLSALKLEYFLTNNTEIENGHCINTLSGKIIRACLPMHTFGFPCEIEAIKEICDRFSIVVVEDAAESLGSKYKEQQVGTFGAMGCFSFNGNKVITAGGGGMIVTNDKMLADKAKHITTTAKKPHAWEYEHDQVAYNYRMPNINAALGLAQLESIDIFLEAKNKLSDQYNHFFEDDDIDYIQGSYPMKANYWLNTICLKDKETKNLFLEFTNNNGVMTRPAWKLMHHLPMYADSCRGELKNAEWLVDRIVNIPSTPIL